jgi:putative transposase
MRLGIRLHLAGLSLSNTGKEIEKFGVQCSRKAIHDWVQKAELQSVSDASPDQIAVDETVIRIDGRQSYSNTFLHVRLFPTTTTPLTERFLQDLREKHDVDDAVFLVAHAQHLKPALQRVGLRFQTVRHGNRSAAERNFLGLV